MRNGEPYPCGASPSVHRATASRERDWEVQI